MNERRVLRRILQMILIAVGLIFITGLLSSERWVSFVFGAVMVTIIALPLTRYPKFTLPWRVVSVVVLLIMIRIGLEYHV